MNKHIQISVPLLFLALYILGGYLEHALKISPVPNRPVALSRSYNDSTVPRLHPTAEHLRLYLKRKEMNDNIQSNQFVILHMYVVFDGKQNKITSPKWRVKTLHYICVSLVKGQYIGTKSTLFNLLSLAPKVLITEKRRHFSEMEPQ